jgi:hypothetical protein
VQLIRYQSQAGAIAVALASENQPIAHLPTPELPMHALLRMHLDSLRECIEQSIRLTTYHKEQLDGVVQCVLAPLDGATEVWGAGMTYNPISMRVSTKPNDQSCSLKLMLVVSLGRRVQW